MLSKSTTEVKMFERLTNELLDLTATVQGRQAGTFALLIPCCCSSSSSCSGGDDD
jgi:hypothetical protein